MPMVSIKWVEGHSQERRDIIAKRVNEAIHEVTGIAADQIWVTFEDVKAVDWYVGDKSVAVHRAAAAKTAAPAKASKSQVAAGKGAKAGGGKKAAKKK